MNARAYTDRQRAILTAAWESGGTLALGLALSKVRPRFTVSDYAEAVRVAREDTGDTTDYSDDAAVRVALARKREG